MHSDYKLYDELVERLKTNSFVTEWEKKYAEKITSRNSFALTKGERKVVESIIDGDQKDVHTEHCCSEHKSCKYNDSDCSVVTGAKRASHPCNCDW